MCPFWVMFLVLCIILYTLKFSKIKICEIPLGIILLIIAVSYYIYNNKTKENFTDEKKIKVYNFNTTWCGWSKKFQPEWDKFTVAINNLENSADYEIKDIKCDDIENNPIIKAMVKKYKVPGYPHIIIEINNNIIAYDGNRNANDLYNYIIKL